MHPEMTTFVFIVNLPDFMGDSTDRIIQRYLSNTCALSVCGHPVAKKI